MRVPRVREVLERHLGRRSNLWSKDDSPMYDVLDGDLLSYVEAFLRDCTQDPDRKLSSTSGIEDALELLAHADRRLRFSSTTLKRTVRALRDALIAGPEPSEYTH
jgi:hypothetical protein